MIDYIEANCEIESEQFIMIRLNKNIQCVKATLIGD